jgi:hypothetical protein
MPQKTIVKAINFIDIEGVAYQNRKQCRQSESPQNDEKHWKRLPMRRKKKNDKDSNSTTRVFCDAVVGSGNL